VWRRLPSELSLWCLAVQGTLRHRRRRREIVVRRRDQPDQPDQPVVTRRAAVRHTPRHRRNGRRHTIAMVSGLVLGSTVPAWALIATISTPQVYGSMPSDPSTQAQDPQPYAVESSRQTPEATPTTSVLSAGAVSALTPAGVAATSAPGVALPSARSTWYAWTPPTTSTAAAAAPGTYAVTTGPMAGTGTGTPTKPQTPTGDPTPEATETGTGTPEPTDTQTGTPPDTTPQTGTSTPDTPATQPGPETPTQTQDQATPPADGSGTDVQPEGTPTRTYEAGRPGGTGGLSTP
jgi:hypothetical protein